jgi:Uma2 family endonuclease
VEEFYLASEKGIFDPDEKLELIWGEVIELSAQLSRHAAATYFVAEAFRSAFNDAVIRQHSPLSLDDMNEPEPDVVVARGPASAYGARHPSASDTLLVVEVADSSLRKDRTLKSTLYASFGIAEYWIFDLNLNRLEIYRDPKSDGEGASYTSLQTFGRDETVSPILGNGAALKVSSLLPE